MRCGENVIYVVDTDETVHDALAILLGADGTRIECYRNAEEFLVSNTVDRHLCGCVLVEADLPGMGSLALIRHLREAGVNLPVVVLASTSNRDIARQALKAGAAEVIEKPLLGDRLPELLCELETASTGGIRK